MATDIYHAAQHGTWIAVTETNGEWTAGFGETEAEAQTDMMMVPRQYEPGPRSIVEYFCSNVEDVGDASDYEHVRTLPASA